ncbi:MAG TPA: LysM peptidoglycan-binding domain-containing protein [Candidatus Dorea gallistercoris]|uniref:LysM peptidoglycan-binding domain-containing protein n=1 Tax=Candidatus Dorea gallistercoris TaxID=2838542 RepID=A0A9D1R7R5_9FIRM|nr:LysM peptidoglycan-binding domain-containing protein [Candidatus Dorea gallistercoris]
MERQFPKNVRQIGNVCDEPKIYVEDYVDTYLNQLRTKAVDAPTGAVFTGEIQKVDGQDVVYISGALRLQEIEIKGTDILIGKEVWDQAEADRKEFFPDLEIVGWCLVETGHPMGLNRGVNKVHSKSFGRENTIFVWKDALEADELFYAYKYGELMQMGGHYIYYEKNPAMQNYMISTRKKIGVTPSEVVEDRAAKNFRSAVKEQMEYRESRQNSRFVYVMSVLLVVIVLAIGISTINNFDKMEAVQNSIETLSQSVDGQGTRSETVNEPESSDGSGLEQGQVSEDVVSQEAAEAGLSEEDFYTVEKGDTLDSISVKIYGDTSHVEAICKMNGLSDGNLIFIGQKLLLP